jgi:hypothetical protein
MAGTPSSTVGRQGAGTTPPGFGFSQDFFNSLIGMANNNPFPVYQGQIDPGLSPTLQNIMQQAQGMSQQGAPSIFQGIQGSLGSFLNPQFQNPNLRIPQGYSDYFGMNPQQQLFGGQQLGGLGFSGPVGMPGSPGASDPNQPFSNVSNMGPGVNGSTGNPPSTWGSGPGLDMSGRAPLVPGGANTSMPLATPGQQAAAGSAGPTPAPSPPVGGSQPSAPPQGQGGYTTGTPTPYSSPFANTAPGQGWSQAQGDAYLKDLMQHQYGAGGSAGFGGGSTAPGTQGGILSSFGFAAPQQASGVQTAWNMGEGTNRGQMRIDPATGEAQILMGAGQGGPSPYSWQKFDPMNYGQVQNAEMFGRYGNNWTSGGAAGQYAGHTAFGAGDNQQNVYDSYYGVH